MCQICSSSNLVELVAEVCLHFPGLKGLKVEPIFVFPNILVCASCGFVQSQLSERELGMVSESASKCGMGPV